MKPFVTLLCLKLSISTLLAGNPKILTPHHLDYTAVLGEIQFAASPEYLKKKNIGMTLEFSSEDGRMERWTLTDMKAVPIMVDQVHLDFIDNMLVEVILVARDEKKAQALKKQSVLLSDPESTDQSHVLAFEFRAKDKYGKAPAHLKVVAISLLVRYRPWLDEMKGDFSIYQFPIYNLKY